MGDREDLSALQWNVNDLINSNATIQIVDTATGGWGHINVDQIVQTDTSLGSVVTITNRYLCLPVKTGATRRLFELVVDGLVTHEFFIELADTVTPDFYSFLDLTNFQGKQALVRVDSLPATMTNLNSLIWSNGIVGANTFYQEANRPIYHVTARRGWLNDPNGLVYFNGEYHLGFQHNPYGWNWANMHWAHLVSPDLVHWTELPEWLYPDPLGAMWSGSAIVDWNNSAGFGTNAMIAFYTGAAKGSDPNLPRMANAGQFTQCMAYSLDSGRTWTKYTNNPVVPNLVGGDNRDPKVFWYAPGNKWVMVLWLNNNDYGIFSSTNLKSWTQTSTFTFPGVIEVPDMFQLPLDGNAGNQKWIFWGGAGNYYLGSFDGNAFTAQTGPFTLRGGDCFAATQTYNNIPGDARRILIVHGTAQFPGMPFNNNINFPMDLTLRTSPSGARLYANPVPELALLRISTNIWPAQSLLSGSNVIAGTYGEAFDLDATFQPGTASSVIFNLRGTAVTYNCAAQTITCNSTTQSLAPSNGVVRLQILVDRGTIEIFGNGGLLYMPMRVTPTAGAQAVSLVANGSGATLNSLQMHNLSSAWGDAAVTRNSYPIARWRMEAQATTPNTAGAPAFNGVLDAATATGQGIVAVGGVVPAERDDLITFNSLVNGPVALSNSVPPASMFVNGNTAGSNSFNAAAYSGGDGALFSPQDVYGNEFSFNSAFSIELFFKTHGNQSGAGKMQLVMQGEGAFRYGIVLNDALPGSVKFIVTNQVSMQAVAALSNTNYADGGWTRSPGRAGNCASPLSTPMAAKRRR
jgi:sucrose-6-phosphate hydrolase SacC (GH32 family)